MNWVDDLDIDERAMLNRIAGSLDLPELKKYESKIHFLHDILSRIISAGALARQVNKVLGGR